MVVAQLLRLGYRVRFYNGVRDLSSCNHLGNLNVALHLCAPTGSTYMHVYVHTCMRT